MSEFSFGKRSRDNLNTCHGDLIDLMNFAIKHTPIDFAVTEGHRTADRQELLFSQGMSKLDGVTKKSRHQSKPSEAVDIAPYPIDWDGPFARYRFYWLSGVIMAHASRLAIPITFGGDWDGDGDLSNQSVFDLPHFELKGLV